MITHPNGQTKMTFQCPKCGAACVGKEGLVTLVGYFSPNGHDHDDNCRNFGFRCDCGHVFTVTPVNTCPTDDCEWIGKITCRTCGPRIWEAGIGKHD